MRIQIAVGAAHAGQGIDMLTFGDPVEVLGDREAHRQGRIDVQ